MGRPIAVVRAQLRAASCSRPTDVDLSDPVRAGEWARAQESLQRFAFPVRIGELTRTDDGVLGFFVDDDYSRLAARRQGDRGQRARLRAAAAASSACIGAAGGVPGVTPIEHPYVVGPDAAHPPTTPTRCCCTSARR